MNFEQIQTNVTDFIQEMMEEEGIEQLTNEQMSRWPLDKRAMPYHMHADKDSLFVPKSQVGNLDYYGGFEYVDRDHRMEVGEWVVFSTEAGRVREVVERMLDLEVEEV